MGEAVRKFLLGMKLKILMRNYLETERFLGDGWNDGERGVVGELVLWI